MWSSGISQHLLGTPETSRRGRSTRKARRALTSNPPGLPPCPCIEGWGTSPSPSPFSSLVNSSKTTLKSLSENKGRNAHYWSAKEDNLTTDSQFIVWVHFQGQKCKTFGRSSLQMWGFAAVTCHIWRWTENLFSFGPKTTTFFNTTSWFIKKIMNWLWK